MGHVSTTKSLRVRGKPVRAPEAILDSKARIGFVLSFFPFLLERWVPWGEWFLNQIGARL